MCIICARTCLVERDSVIVFFFPTVFFFQRFRAKRLPSRVTSSRGRCLSFKVHGPWCAALEDCEYTNANARCIHESEPDL